MRQRWDCLAAERRVSWVRTFWAVSGSRVVAIFGRGEDLVGVVRGRRDGWVLLSCLQRFMGLQGFSLLGFLLGLYVGVNI